MKEGKEQGAELSASASRLGPSFFTRRSPPMSSASTWRPWLGNVGQDAGQEHPTPKVLAYSPGWWPAYDDWPKKNCIITGGQQAEM